MHIENVHRQIAARSLLTPVKYLGIRSPPLDASYRIVVCRPWPDILHDNYLLESVYVDCGITAIASLASTLRPKHWDRPVSSGAIYLR